MAEDTPSGTGNSLARAAALLRDDQAEAAAQQLRELLADQALPLGYPVRHLVSAARGLLTLLPEPHIPHALDCLERARKLLATIEPGQTTLW